jgi:hypothetical protein
VTPTTALNRFAKYVLLARPPHRCR